MIRQELAMQLIIQLSAKHTVLVYYNDKSNKKLKASNNDFVIDSLQQ